MAENQTVVGQALAQMNEANNAIAIGAAQRMVNLIVSEQNRVKGAKAAIAKAQAQVKEITDSILTVEGVLGRPVPSSPNANEKTVIKTIEQMVKEAQDEVKDTVSPLLETITENQLIISGSEERLAERRKDLAAIVPVAVDESIVAG